MTEETIVAVFDTAAHADAAVRDLESTNVPSSAITRQPGATGATTTAAPAREQGFWASLFGGEPDHDTAVYDRSLEGGSHIVSVRVPEDHVAAVVATLERNNPIDIDERAASYGMTQTSTTTRQPIAAPMQATATRPTTAEGGSIQLAEESLVVGKRVVNRGGTRIRRFVVETPVEKQVTLHEEKVVVERHPVSGAQVGQADFSDKTIELTETAEEAVVGKTARVVEEVALRKEAVDRTETIRDTVRKEEVEIEQIPGTATTTTTGTTIGTTGTTTGTTTNPRASNI